jgi:hypothetical protein
LWLAHVASLVFHPSPGGTAVIAEKNEYVVSRLLKPVRQNQREMATHLEPSAPRAELTPVAPTCYGHRADSASNFPPPYHSFIFPYAKKKGMANAPSPFPDSVHSLC